MSGQQGQQGFIPQQGQGPWGQQGHQGHQEQQEHQGQWGQQGQQGQWGQQGQHGQQGQQKFGETVNFNQGQYGWNNQHGLNLPQINFDSGCKKCHGCGSVVNKKGLKMPCKRCYRRNGFCRFCYGTGTNFNKNKPCKKCHGGKKGGKHKEKGLMGKLQVGGGYTSSSSGSDSD
eukprot:GHVR01019600.1.p1 GENE.GHVR01019600.1~~GHVR01019600.1.p1  ORF type:complete len:173 (+),score=18.02 GHVR01019600.1:39-557(+)